MKMLVLASKERENHVNRKPQTAGCYDRSLYRVQRNTQKRYPILCGYDNLSAKVLKFELSLKGNIKS